MKYLLIFVSLFFLLKMDLGCANITTNESPAEIGKEFRTDGFLREEAIQHETLEDKDTCSSVCSCLKKQKEKCNGKDDDCDGEIDEGLSIPCPSVTGELCSPGKKTCTNGEFGPCEGRVFKLSPSCLSKEDLDCDNQPDQAELGRKSKLYHLIQEKQIIHKIIDVKAIDGVFYILLLREKSFTLSIELWLLNQEAKKLSAQTFLKSASVHGNITKTRTTGRIFVYNSDFLLIQYCTKKDPLSSGSPSDSVNYCQLHRLELKTFKSQAIKISKRVPNSDTADFFYAKGPNEKQHYLFVAETPFEPKLRRNKDITSIHAYQIDSNFIVSYQSSLSQTVKRTHFPQHQNLFVGLVGTSVATIRLVLSSTLIDSKNNTSPTSISMLSYNTGTKSWAKSSHKTNSIVAPVGPIQKDDMGWTQIYLSNMYEPKQKKLVPQLFELRHKYPNSSWSMKELSELNSQKYYGKFFNAIILGKGTIVNVAATVSCVTDNGTNQRLEKSDIHLYYMDKNKNLVKSFLIAKEPMPSSIHLFSSQGELSLLWLSSPQWNCSRNTNIISLVKVGTCGGEP